MSLSNRRLYHRANQYASSCDFFLPDTVEVLIHVSLTPMNNEQHIIKHAPNSFLGINILYIGR